MWEFSVALYMINIWPESLLYAAIYGASDSASIAVFGPIIGRWVDKLSCLKVTTSIAYPNLVNFVILCLMKPCSPFAISDHILLSGRIQSKFCKSYKRVYKYL